MHVCAHGRVLCSCRPCAPPALPCGLCSNVAIPGTGAHAAQSEGAFLFGRQILRGVVCGRGPKPWCACLAPLGARLGEPCTASIAHITIDVLANDAHLRRMWPVVLAQASHSAPCVCARPLRSWWCWCCTRLHVLLPLPGPASRAERCAQAAWRLQPARSVKSTGDCCFGRSTGLGCGA
jgi:hypothetical protein